MAPLASVAAEAGGEMTCECVRAVARESAVAGEELRRGLIEGAQLRMRYFKETEHVSRELIEALEAMPNED